jgi:hypothetical protein
VGLAAIIALILGYGYFHSEMRKQIDAANPVLPKPWRREIRPELLTTIRLGGAILIGTVIAALSNSPL